ncbi:MAG: hypothetical protein ACE14M_10980 [Terriglobales bacterium]
MKYDFSFHQDCEETKVLKFPNKKLRARVIADYVRTAGYRGVVVFTCGNSAAALREQGLEVVEIGPRGDLQTGKWWKAAEIHRLHPELFDATSGHLPLVLMVEVAKAFRAHLGDLPAGHYAVPTGSGETIMCLRAAYPQPDIVFLAAYDNRRPETERDPMNPLNDFVDALFAYDTPLFARTVAAKRKD